MPLILVIDDDPVNAKLVARICRADGLSITAAPNGKSGIESVTATAPDVVLLDIDLPDMNGLSVLQSIATLAPSLPVIMLTGDRDLKTAIQATRLGAFDYVTKPINPAELLNAVRRAVETVSLRRQVQELRRRVGEGGDLGAQLGSSAQAREVVDQVQMVAPSLFTVLITGETGSGKELVAQAIHRESDRRAAPFVALDCGAIPESLLQSELFGHRRAAFAGTERSKASRFQVANGGTLFLDEIGNLPMDLQSRLLRVLESEEVLSVGGARASDLGVRFVAATNDDLGARVASGHFRADLYFRLAQYTIEIPPLRKRTGDIAYLATRFLEEASNELRRPVRSLLPEAIELLERQPWPGNVRELRNVVRQAVLRSKDLVIRKEHLRALIREVEGGSPGIGKPGAVTRTAAGRSLREIVSEAASAAEKQAICETLRAANGNKSEAARTLRTDYKTLHLKIKKHGIRARDFAKS